MKRSYQEKLDSERDATLKFKGENGEATAVAAV